MCCEKEALETMGNSKLVVRIAVRMPPEVSNVLIDSGDKLSPSRPAGWDILVAILPDILTEVQQLRLLSE